MSAVGAFVSNALTRLAQAPLQHIFNGSIAYGLAACKAWPRHLVIAIFVLIIVYASALGALNVLRHTIMWRAIVNASLFGGASAWYFYFKPNVAEYFWKLRAR